MAFMIHLIVKHGTSEARTIYAFKFDYLQIPYVNTYILSVHF